MARWNTPNVSPTTSGKLKDGEVAVLSRMVYVLRRDRDRINQLSMAAPASRS